MNYFEAKLARETDPADLAADPSGVTILDTRSREAYEAGHLPGALLLRELDEIPPGPLVVYCWGPGCNGATKAAARLLADGHDVKEMIGGFEYWQREGHPVISAAAAR